MKYVRWMLAYANTEGSLADALYRELVILSGSKMEVACEPIKTSSYIHHVTVGLLLGRDAIKKVFPSDVYSFRQVGDWKLTKSRKPKNLAGYHGEAFALPRYIGIVINKKLHSLDAETREAVVGASKKYNLPLIYFDNNGTFKTILKGG